ncbi:hypothetical protein [Dermatophilus congolensis]|nr:hypothetical protein [Dermatophilus congolensis]
MTTDFELIAWLGVCCFVGVCAGVGLGVVVGVLFFRVGLLCGVALGVSH